MYLLVYFDGTFSTAQATSWDRARAGFLSQLYLHWNSVLWWVEGMFCTGADEWTRYETNIIYNLPPFRCLSHTHSLSLSLSPLLALFCSSLTSTHSSSHPYPRVLSVKFQFSLKLNFHPLLSPGLSPGSVTHTPSCAFMVPKNKSSSLMVVCLMKSSTRTIKHTYSCTKHTHIQQ